jgi:hypothetical protein
MSMSSDLRLDLPFVYSAADREFVYETASSFLLHILYVRSVIPMPFMQLAEESSRISSLAKISSVQRKLLKAVHDTGEVLASLRDAAQHLDVQTVTLLLGPSAISAKEVYHLHFIKGQGSPARTGVKQLNFAKRRVVQKLIEYNCNVDYPAPTRPNFYVAINVAEVSADDSAHTHTHSISGNTQQAGVSVEGGADGTGVDPASSLSYLVSQTQTELTLFKHFSYRDPFKVRVRKRGPPVVHLRVTSADAVCIAAVSIAPIAPIAPTTPSLALDTSHSSGSTNVSGASGASDTPSTGNSPLEPDSVRTAAAAAAAGAGGGGGGGGGAAAAGETASANGGVAVAGGSKWLVQKKGIKAIRT